MATSPKKDERLKMLIQQEISPTNNIKNYQRQAQLNKNYEQSEPFELPGNEEFPFPLQMADHGWERILQEKAMEEEYNRYSFKNIKPFNPPDDTPSDVRLRKKPQHIEADYAQTIENPPFLSKKYSAPVNGKVDQRQNYFLNNYFLQLAS
eukprot:CAMPEP_0170565712 /NCGR_PEP_ID=MMETSP0211-20121228/79366_1 /TAXON_ID=311385 /ORGANISM="Pseudokeronopsis sp., Strain OXSARD2" /LENGTH=149 /DNA_ID=CAMNT_0010886665 /DNA_START=2464 /DNA_END=2913 /DNA_ORIENTATION=-